MCLWLSYKKKIWGKFFFGILKVTEERSRIRSWKKEYRRLSREQYFSNCLFYVQKKIMPSVSANQSKGKQKKETHN